MKRNYFNAVLIISLLLGVTSAVLLQQSSNSMKLAAALTGLSGYLFLGYARDKSVTLSNMSQVKMELNVSSELFELMILGSLLATPMIPQRLGIAVLASVTFLKIFIEEAGNQMNTDLTGKLGQNYRIYTVLTATALSILNTQYVYLSAYVLLGIILYDLGQILYQFYDNKQGIKLKNRILSK